VTVRVVLAEDQELVRSGFRMISRPAAISEVVGEAGDGAEAAAWWSGAARCRAHGRAHAAGRRPRGHPAHRGVGSTARVIVLTTYDADEYVFAALRAGASGFMLKDVRRRPRRGHPGRGPRRRAAGPLGDPSASRPVRRRAAGAGGERPADLGGLTEREIEVLSLVALALTNAEIAQRLVLTEATVKTHVSSILRKLDLRDRVQAVVLAYDVGLARPRAL
jgi:DNA-binding NarL/FixJ family response regulator